MQQFRLFRGKSGRYFVENITTKKQSSLRTRDEDEAQRLLFAQNEAHREPIACLQMARAYLMAADPLIKTRTWQTVMAHVGEAKRGPTKLRWERACKDRAFDVIRDLKLAETRAEEFWKVLKMTQTTTINGAVTQTLTYSYGSSNELMTIVNQAGVLQSSYVYDSAGNRIEKITPAGNTYYAYNEQNLLTTVVTPTDYILYTYNGVGQRVSQNVDGVLTSFIIDPSQSVYQNVQERNGTAIASSPITVSHVFGTDHLGNNPVTGTSQFYLPDRIGTVMLITDPSGNITTSNSFDGFGATPRP